MTTRRTNRTPKARKNWKPTFLTALQETGMVKAACEAAGVGRSTVYDARQRDEEFALAWADIEAETTEKLEAEAVRRALDGSDTLLIFLLKSNRPEKYRENVKVEHTGKLRQQVEHIEPEDTDEYRAKVATIAAQVLGITNDDGH